MFKFSKFNYLIFIIFFFPCPGAFAQHSKIEPFKNGETVCFIGNSITHAGEFHHNIFLYYLTRFPERKIQFYNNGISGDVTAGILNRMDDDILFHKPTTAVIMIGMNDVMRSLYTVSKNPSQDTLERRANALITYKINLDSIVKILLNNHVRVILQKPSIYDQTAVLPKENAYGSNDAIKICADFMQTLADKYKLGIVDYWTIMSEINATMQKADPSATIVGGDRIHPGPVGNLVMAYQFIHTTNNPGYTTRIVIKNTDVESNKNSFNTKIEKLVRNQQSLNFTTTEYALPFPVTERAMKALDLIPINDSINRQVLQVAKLDKGNYQLKINEVTTGNFTDAELRHGVNLTNYRNTPQYVQSLAIRKFLDDKYFPTEAAYRNIKFFEYRNLKGMDNKADTTAIRLYVYNKNSKNITAVKPAIDKYLALKPKQSQLLDQLKNLNEQAHAMNEPQKYHYSIAKINN